VGAHHAHGEDIAVGDMEIGHYWLKRLLKDSTQPNPQNHNNKLKLGSESFPLTLKLFLPIAINPNLIKFLQPGLVPRA